jgi:hypothetical protein
LSLHPTEVTAYARLKKASTASCGTYFAKKAENIRCLRHGEGEDKNFAV